MPCSLTEAGCQGGRLQPRGRSLGGLHSQASKVLVVLKSASYWPCSGQCCGDPSTAPKGPPARKQLFEWNRDAGCDRAWRRLETHKDLPSAAHGTIRAIYLLLSQLAQILGCSRTD